MPKNQTNNHNNLEQTLWAAADKLRGHLDAAEYKHVVLGLIFLKYISDAFEEKYHQLKLWTSDSSHEYYVKEPRARYYVMEDRDEYIAENIFWVPEEARWPHLQASAKSLEIGILIDKAMANYTRSGGRQIPAQNQAQAVALMKTNHERVKDFFHTFDYAKFFNGTPVERLAVIPRAMEHVLQQQSLPRAKRGDDKKRYMDGVTRLSKAFALAMPDQAALDIRDDVAFFQAVRASFAKHTPIDGKSREDMEGAIKQLVSRAVASDEVVNIFDAAGLKTPDVSILSDEFLSEIQDMEHKNLALELLRKLLQDEIRARARTNLCRPAPSSNSWKTPSCATPTAP